MFGIDTGIAQFGGAVLGYMGAQDQIDSQQDMFHSAQRYNQYNADTQWQRAVKDMQAAGLNPMLAYAKGGNTAASSPQPMQGVNKWEAAMNSAGAFADIDVKFAQAEKLRADAALSRETAGTPTEERNKIRQEAILIVQNQHLSAAQRSFVMEQTQNALEENRLIKERTGNVAADTAILKINEILQKNLVQQSSNMAEAQKSWWMRNISPYLPDILKSTGSARGAAGVFK